MSESELPGASQWREAVRWLAFASEDLRVAQLTSVDASVVGAMAFHVQQAVEKVLKALLTAASADFRLIHDIDELASLTHRHWPRVIPQEFPLARVTAWYIASRYPGLDEVSINHDEVVAALQEAETLLAEVTRLVPPGLRSEGVAGSDGPR